MTHPRFHENDGGNDLQAIADPVLQLFKQHILLSQESLLLPQQILPLALERPSRSDIFNAQQEGRMGIALVKHLAGIQ